MKVAIILAAVVAVACGAPVIQANWLRIASKVDQLEAAVTGGITAIITVAKNDNNDVGTDIELKFNLPVIQAQVLLEQARVAIRAQTLTGAQARQHFADLDKILRTTQTDLTVEFAKLSAAARTSINNLFTQAFTVAERLGNEVYVLLADDGDNSGVDWTKLDGKVEEIRTVVKDAFTGSGSIAVADDPINGAIVQIQLANTEGGIHTQIGRMKGGISGQSLTYEEAHYFLNQIQIVVNRSESAVEEDLVRLSQTAQTQIRSLIAVGAQQTYLKTEEALKFLDKSALIFVPDWNAVDAKVEELRGVISTAVETVRSTAVADNPTVGHDIARQLNIAAAQANAVLGRAKGAIRDQSLTAEQARALLQELDNILNGLTTDLRGPVSQLSPAAQKTISDTLTNARSQAEQRAREIVNLLQ